MERRLLLTKIMLGQTELCIEMEYTDNNSLMEDSQDAPQNEAQIYKRIKVLGSGAYGRAFLVQHRLSGQEWVIKQINLADLAPEQQQAAEKQAKILQMLDHLHIIRFKQVYRTLRMKLNIVMEYAAEGDLAQRIKHAKQTKTHIPEPQILKWFAQICLALLYVHNKKIIHRDIKAQNVFLTQDGVVKLGDFGVAKVLEHTVAKARTVVGSPYYLSPEIIENKPYSFKTDVWSLGALLFEMCALHPPFEANNLQFLALKIVQGGPPQLPKMYSEGMRALVRSMLQTKQSNRPTVGEILKTKIVANTIQQLVSELKLQQQQMQQQQLQQQQQQQLQQPHTISDFSKFNTLKPPPNLLDIAENRSDLVMGSKEREQEQFSPTKIAKTPNPIVKKGPNNFFNRPVSGRRKVEVASNELADLIQIKPSVIQRFQRHQKPYIPLPILPKPPTIVKALSPPVRQIIDIRKTERQKQKKVQITSPPSTAFTKKRPSLAHIEKQKLQPPEKAKKQDLKIEVAKPNRELKKIEPKKQKEVKKPSSSKVQIKKKQISLKKQTPQLNLQVCSEQAKKKIIADKKLQKKKSQKKVAPQRRQKKRPATQHQPNTQPIMEQEKCNSENELNSNHNQSDYYEQYQDDAFQSYSSHNSDVDLSFSDTGNNIASSSNNFLKMIANLQIIQKCLQNGEDIDKTAHLSESIPEVITLSNSIRADDLDLDSNHSTRLEDREQTNNQINLKINNLSDPGELENLRIKLEQAMGVDNILFTYHALEQKIDAQGLNFSEEQTIQEIRDQRPQISEQTLRQNIGFIVAILIYQKNLI